METRVTPNKEIEIKVYALSYETGVLYEKSDDNSNVTKDAKSKNTIIRSIFMTPAYTYEEAAALLHELLLKQHDLFLKEVIINDFTAAKLNTLFDEAFSMHGNVEFKAGNTEDDKEETS